MKKGDNFGGGGEEGGIFIIFPPELINIVLGLISMARSPWGGTTVRNLLCGRIEKEEEGENTFFEISFLRFVEFVLQVIF